MVGLIPTKRCRRRHVAGRAACLAMLFGMLLGSPARALDQVSLQLKWKHQFQFAGYYAAIEKGFYRENGLEVDIREGGPNVDASATVAAGGQISASARTAFCSTRINAQTTLSSP